MALFLFFPGAASAAPLCQGGEVIWDNGSAVGCIFNSWGPNEAAQCQGAVVLPVPPGATCHICVRSSYVPVINNPALWNLLHVGTRWPTAQPADFSCFQSQCNRPIYLTDDLTSNRSGALPRETLQVVAFYDGDQPGGVELRFETIDIQGQVCWETIDQLDVFTNSIASREYDLNGVKLTGNFEVVGVVPNGTVDGLAFGLYWKDSADNYHILKSNQASPIGISDFVGGWPVAMGEGTFAARTPQITDGNARAQARATIHGAAMLPDGVYTIPIY